MRYAAAAFVLALVTAVQAHTVEPLRHGEDLTASAVGPVAGGYASRTHLAAGEIKGGTAYPLAKEIAATATYDGFRVVGPHLLIEGASFTAPLDISSPQPVVMRGVSVRVPAASPWTILVRPSAGPFYFLWSEAGSDDNGGKPPASALDLRGDGAVVYRAHLSGTADGIDISGAHARVSETLIDNLATFAGSHNDGIQLGPTAADVKIARSKILNPNPQTSCLYLLGRDIEVTQTYLAGGGWTLYGGARINSKGGAGASDVRVMDTIFGRDFWPRSGHFGPLSYWDSSAGNLWRNNRFNDGTAIKP